MAIVAPRSESSPFFPECWKQSLKVAFRDLDALTDFLELPRLSDELPAGNDFPLFVPREFAAKMSRGRLDDPLLQQVLPQAEEWHDHPAATMDPLQESAAQLTPGLLQKYEGRALLVTTGACAVHCRYCFRRHFPYQTVPKSIDAWKPALNELRQNDTIHEVLLSGGDPLMLVDELLHDLLDELESISHIRRVRIHTRLPVMIPQRLTDPLVKMLSERRFASYVVIHANHPTELCDQVLAGVNQLTDSGIPVLNQAVLLKGINDTEEILTQLCEKLIDHRILPYYLHQLDPVEGTMHFEVDTQRGLELIELIRKRLPGYGVPTYVQELAGFQSKMPLK